MTDQMPYGASYLAFGVAVRFESRDSRLFRKTIEMAQRSLVGNLSPTDDQPQHLFRVGRTKARGFYFEHNGALVTDGKIERGVLKYFDSYLRVTVAENCPDRVFVHSGAVAIDGKAILLPGNSFTGKSTLTHELVKLGCKYLSDEFAILDEDGLVSPYARPINLRTED